MTMRNQLLCRLLGPAGIGLPATDTFEKGTAGEEAVLAAMCLARAGQVGRFEALLPSIDADGIAVLSRYCLMLALAADGQTPMLLFDALRQVRPGLASFWLDLAQAQSARGFLTQAVRSIALANALAGKGLPVGPLPDPVEGPRGGEGGFHVLPGNEKRFFSI